MVEALLTGGGASRPTMGGLLTAVCHHGGGAVGRDCSMTQRLEAIKGVVGGDRLPDRDLLRGEGEDERIQFGG